MLIDVKIFHFSMIVGGLFMVAQVHKYNPNPTNPTPTNWTNDKLDVSQPGFEVLSHRRERSFTESLCLITAKMPPSPESIVSFSQSVIIPNHFFVPIPSGRFMVPSIIFYNY
jgi:hypothetical protein